jgi:Fe-S oxidoreductase
MAECQRSQIGDEPLQIRALEAACVRLAKNKAPDVYRLTPKEKRVAVVGAGLSGLSCALALAQKKYSVTVFERGRIRGGSLSSHEHIRDFLSEFDLQFSAVDVDFVYEREILSVDELFEAGFDAIYIATGRDSEMFALKDWEPNRLTTSVPGVFMGGEVCGMSRIGGAACGARAAKYIETFLMTGSALLTGEEDERVLEKHYVPHDGIPSAARVVAADAGAGYTKDEAESEASRCMGCDCRLCMDACEMLASFKKTPQKIAIEAYTDTNANPPFSSCTMTRETFSCNICGYCKKICPVDVDMGALFSTARSGRVEVKTDPKVFHDFWLRDFSYTVEDAAFSYLPADAKYLYFPGCKLSGLAPDLVRQSYRLIQDTYGAGLVLNCCGAPAYWAGEEALLRSHLEVLRDIWLDAGHPTFIFACAYCKKIFGEFLPEIQSLSVYEVIGERYCAVGDLQTGAGRAPRPAGLGAPSEPLSVFDPCAMDGDEQARSAVRKIAKAAGLAAEDLPEPGRCCGFGGHMGIANPSLYGDIIGNRIALSDRPFIVSCANCYELFTDRGKDCLHILDAYFGHFDKRAIPDLDEKRHNLISLKEALMAELTGEVSVPASAEWDGVVLSFDPGVREDIDRRRILADEIREAIYTAERAGDYFTDTESGRRICCLVKPVLTCWVTYSESADSPAAFTVHGAYSHRMKFREEL